MAKIVLSTIGSLGDLHPKLALALELRKRGHNVVLNTWQGYAERIAGLGFDFKPIRPNVDPSDKEISRKVMSAGSGPEYVIKELMMGNIRPMYEDLLDAVAGADLFLSGEIVYAAKSVAEKTGIKWISTSLAPISMFSAYDPSIYVESALLEHLWSLPVIFHKGMLGVMRIVTRNWLDEYRKFRSEIGLDADHDPLFREKFSPLLHLAMFSKVLGRPQPDWPFATLQTGFCFYDESETSSVDKELSEFLDSGESPIVFTLGSAAVMDAGDFFDESVGAAALLGRRAILLYGRDKAPPAGLTPGIAAFEYAPFSQVFPRAVCVVHQGGIGTTGQVLSAGVPHLIVPFSHDQPDNAYRCRRAGVAEMINRDKYNARSAAAALRSILDNPGYSAKAAALRSVVAGENGTVTACDAIEYILRK